MQGPCPNAVKLLYLALEIMQISLTIIRYPIVFVPFAFIAMAIFRIPLMLNNQIGFYKLMGCGKNGTFDKIPDLQQWAILCAYRKNINLTGASLQNDKLFGRFISGWLRFFRCECFTILLEPIEGHGSWDKKTVFGLTGNKSEHQGPIATLTRATIRLNRLSYFWKHVAPVAAGMGTAKGFITSFGIGEIPWIKQATFSVWESREAMKAFAYGMREHTEVIKKTRREKWDSEDMFVRFAIKGHTGTVKGNNPLNGKLYF